MAYILNNDIPEKFQCSLKLEGSSLSKTSARIIIECDSGNFMYTGEIFSDGKCIIPINNLKKYITEETVGNIRLEVISEDTYFSPWSDTLIIKPSRSLRVESVQLSHDNASIKVNVEKSPILETVKKPSIIELCKILRNSGLTKSLLNENKSSLIKPFAITVKEYYNSFGVKVPNKVVGDILKNL